MDPIALDAAKFSTDNNGKELADRIDTAVAFFNATWEDMSQIPGFTSAKIDYERNLIRAFCDLHKKQFKRGEDWEQKQQFKLDGLEAAHKPWPSDYTEINYVDDLTGKLFGGPNLVVDFGHRFKVPVRPDGANDPQ